MTMLTKQSKVHTDNETIWKSPYLRKFLSLDLANWSIYMETGESCCLKWSFSLTLCEIPWRFSSILPNVKISLTLCKIPWQFPDLEKFHFSLTFPWRLWTLPDAKIWTCVTLTLTNCHENGTLHIVCSWIVFVPHMNIIHEMCNELQSWYSMWDVWMDGVKPIYKIHLFINQPSTSTISYADDEK